MRNKIILFIVILALAVGGVGFWYYQKNIYSKEVLKLEILGPKKADLAEEVEYVVKYKNNGNIRLEEPELVFEYPKHCLEILGGISRVTKSSQDLGGAIYPGEERAFHFKARLLGKEGEVREAKAWLSYRPKNLEARYESLTTFTTQIKKIPLTFEFDLPSKIESGKDIQLSLNYFSNTNYPLSNLRAKIDYSQGFEFQEADPQGIADNEWEIGLLNRAEGGRIKIKGKIRGEVGEQKIFQAQLGTWQKGEFVLLKEAYRGITIVKPSLHITQQINGNPEFIANPGDDLHYEIFFKNVGEEALTDLTLLCTLHGPLDLETLKAPRGEAELGDNSIIWDWRRVGNLQFLPGGKKGKVEFWIKLKEDWEIKNLEDKNPIIKTKIYLSQARKEFENKVNSKLEISQKGYYRDEVFGNSGPIPPEVGKSTTYTIMWHLKNYYNQLKNVKVKAILPDYIKLTGKIFPEKKENKFAFDSDSREIVWNVGDLMLAQGVLNPAPNLSFQIELTPTLDQRGNTPKLISKAQVIGQDQWTEQILEASALSIDTTLPDDSNVTSEQGIVQ